MADKRDASGGMNGFEYQRLYAIKLLLEVDIQNFEIVREEGFEDIDFITYTGNKEIYQIKHHKSTSNSTESLTYTSDKKSGLLKVIDANYDRDNITTIHIINYSINGKPYSKIKELFENNNKYDIIRKLIILLHLNHVNKLNLELSVDMDENVLSKMFNDYEKLIPKNDKYYDFFMDGEKVINYFNKFKLESGDEYDLVKKDIDNTITKRFKEHINAKSTEDFKKMRLNIIFSTVRNHLTRIMFYNKGNDRNLIITEIYNMIEDTIKIFQNPTNLLTEYFASINKNIMDNVPIKYNELITDIKLILKSDKLDHELIFNNLIKIIEKIPDNNGNVQEIITLFGKFLLVTLVNNEQFLNQYLWDVVTYCAKLKKCHVKKSGKNIDYAISTITNTKTRIYELFNKIKEETQNVKKTMKKKSNIKENIKIKYKL